MHGTYFIPSRIVFPKFGWNSVLGGFGSYRGLILRHVDGIMVSLASYFDPCACNDVEMRSFDPHAP